MLHENGFKNVQKRAETRKKRANSFLHEKSVILHVFCTFFRARFLVKIGCFRVFLGYFWVFLGYF